MPATNSAATNANYLRVKARIAAKYDKLELEHQGRTLKSF